jgi:hypothetical protein
MAVFTRRDPFRSRTIGLSTPGAQTRRQARRGQRRHSPLFDRLEDRTVLSPTIFTVTGIGDSPNDPHTSTSGDLRYCIGLADSNTSNPDGSDIQFDPTVFSVPQTITLGSGLDLSNTTAQTTITGPGASSLTVSGGGPTSNFSVFTVNYRVNMDMSGFTIANGFTTGDGGGVQNNGTLILADIVLLGNSASGQYSGGGIENSGAATLTNVTITGNSGTWGGGVDNYSGSMDLVNVTVSGNSASNVGGGIDNGGTATLTDVSVSGNSSSNAGGGILDFGMATLIGVTVSENSAVNGGGGISIAYGASLTLMGSTISGNSAYGAGGIDNGGSAVLTNVTLSGNSATYRGGGIFNSGTAALTNVTLDGNSAANGGGLYNYYYTTTLNNTVVANNTGGGDIYVYNGSVSGNNDLIDDAASSGGLTNGVNGNLVGVNPLLAPLGSYGGPTQTMPLLPSSPAIDAGSNALAVDAQGNPLTTDQRGLPRIVGAAVDIGDFESSGFTLAVASGDNQSTAVGTAFPNALQVTVTPNNAGDPVDGGTVTFTPPASGASATLSPSGLVTIASGAASVAATANSVAGGPYDVMANTAGAAPASFSVSNTPASTLLVTFFGGTGDEQGTGITAVSNGSNYQVYVTGSSDALGGEGLLVDYGIPDPSGNISALWSKQWPGVAGYDRFDGVAANATDVYAAGQSYSQSSDLVGDKEPKGITVNFSPDGTTTNWQSQTPAAPGAFPYGGYESLKGNSIATENGQTYIYATGTAQSGWSNGGRLFLSKLDASGNVQWTVTDAANNAYSFGARVVTLGGAEYVAGGNSDSGVIQAYLKKYDSNGTLVWAQTSVAGQFNGLTPDPSGSYVYTVGQTGGSNADFLIQKWDLNGNVVWSRTYDRSGAEDILNGVASVNGRLFAVGSTRGGTAGGSDGVIIEFDPSTGDLLQTTLWGGAADDSFSDVTATPNRLHVVGTTDSFGAGGSDLVYAVDNIGTVASTVTLNVPSPIVEGQAARVSGTIANPPDQTFQVALDYGDGSSDTLSLDAGTSSFYTEHHYYDESPAGGFTITAQVNGAVAGTASVAVANTPPTVVIGPSSDIALNTSDTGFPTPLESDHGWGGGNQPWEIVDGQETYAQWYHGLAFTGGNNNWDGEPAGPRQATIDFGQNQSFDKVVLWHHGDDHVPQQTSLDYWNGSAWVPISFTRTLDIEPGSTGWSRSDTYTFAPVTGSKVRYSFDNRLQNILGTQITHGWLYEFEVRSQASQITLDGPTLTYSGSFSDPGAHDTFTAAVNYGDGTGGQPLTLNSDKTFNLSHVYATAGTYNLTVTVTDENNGVGAQTVQVVFNQAGLPSIADTGFEQVVVGAGQFRYRPVGSPWTFAGAAGISGNNSGFTSGNPPAPEGAQVGFLQGTGLLSQSVSGWAAGSYTLSFSTAQRGNYQALRQDFNVLVDGIVVGTFTPTGTTYHSYTTDAFTVTAGAHTITFQGLDTAGGDNTAFVDHIVVAQSSMSSAADAGFEQVVVGAGLFRYRPTGSPWAFAGSSGISGNNSGFTSGNPAAPDGAQVAFVQDTGSFSQSVRGWAAGSYILTFKAAQRGNYQASRQDFNVLVDGNIVGTFTPSGTAYQSYTTGAFTVTAGAHTITFQGLDSAGGDNSAFVDQVTIAQASSTSVADQGFEQVSVGSGHFQYRPTGSPWSFAGSAGISGNNSGFTSGNPAAPEGVQVAFLQTTGSFNQSVSGWAAGSYSLGFKAAQRGNYQASRQDFNVLVDGMVAGTFTPSGTSYQSYTTAVFTVTAGAHTIKFQGLDSAGGDNTAFVDQVVIL